MSEKSFDYVVSTAIMKCDKGTLPSLFTATANTTYFVQKKLIGTEFDKIPMLNIKPFGQCLMKPSPGGPLPCIPMPVLWTDVKNNKRVMGGRPLLDKSCLNCACGGRIEFQTTGQIPMPHMVTKISEK